MNIEHRKVIAQYGGGKQGCIGVLFCGSCFGGMNKKSGCKKRCIEFFGECSFVQAAWDCTRDGFILALV